METAAEVLIYIHAALGGIALLAGAIALISKKGNSTHKKAGRIFFYTMLSSALLSLVVASLPGHLSPFLFSIGLFSSYFIISGYRSLGFKRPGNSLMWDKILAFSIVLIGLVMISYPLLLQGELNIILAVFGGLGLVFGLRDMRLLKQPKQLRKQWLKLHLGKMTGGYIAAVTAFLVVNQVLPELMNWFLPTVVGSIYIGYWMSGLRKGKQLKSDKL